MLLSAFPLESAADNRTVQVSVQNPSDSPVELLGAYGNVSTPLPLVGRPESYTATAWEGHAEYRNRGDRTISAIQFHWVLLDHFGQVQWIMDVTDEKDLPRTGSRRQDWKQVIPKEDIGQATLTVQEVRFEDGTLWAATPAEGQAVADETVRRDERQRLLHLYQAQGVDALVEELRR
jgi:hypothetical protein